MTEKELHKLRREDLLELMLAQGQQMEEQQAHLDETIAELEAVQANNERLKEKLNEKDEQIADVNTRLKAKLDDKDEQIARVNARLKEKLDEKDALIEKLKGRLDHKDATIHELEESIHDQQESRRIELEAAGSIAMASLRLNGVFEAAQQAAEQYLYNIKELCREKYGDLADLAELPDVKAKAYIVDVLPEKLGYAMVAEAVAEPEPVVVQEPVAKLEPVVVQEPVAKPEPVVAQEPVAAPQSVVVQEPVAAPQSVVVQEPVVAPQPVVVQQPVVTPQPVTAPQQPVAPAPAETEPDELQEMTFGVRPERTGVFAALGRLFGLK